jgi:ribose 1,5-bisphosphate isomerase
MINVDKVVKDIKSIRIQGATNIAKASISALLDFSKDFKVGVLPKIENCKICNFLRVTEINANKLAFARPDEPLNQNLVDLIMSKLEKDKNKDVKKKIANFQKSCMEALAMIAKNEDLITANGIKLIKKIYQKKKKPVLIFTHCNSSSVFKIIQGAHKEKIRVKVYDSETRPRFQGRIMAKNLAKNGIDVTMMTDSAAPFVISKNDPDKIDVDLVLIGADVVGTDGSVLNKIGSYSLALAAKNAKVPFYTATSLLKVRKDADSYRKIEIEKRDPTELWPAAAKAMAGKQKSLKGIKTINYAFDTVPPEYVAGLITEFGVLKPEKVKKTAGKKYKEIFK